LLRALPPIVLQDTERSVTRPLEYRVFVSSKVAEQGAVLSGCGVHAAIANLSPLMEAPGVGTHVVWVKRIALWHHAMSEAVLIGVLTCS
jgi:hypothetical protein